MLEEDTLFDLLHEINVLKTNLARELGVQCGRGGNIDDVDYVSNIMGGRSLFEFGAVLSTFLGPVNMAFPILGFDNRLGSRSPYYFERVLAMYPEWLQLNWLPIAGDGCGGYFLYPLTPRLEDARPIFLVRPDLSSIDQQRYVSSNVLMFIKRLLQSELAGERGDPFSVELLRWFDPEIEVTAREFENVLAASGVMN